MEEDVNALKYQLACIKAELDFKALSQLTNNSASSGVFGQFSSLSLIKGVFSWLRRVCPACRFVERHLKQLYWTLLTACGLKHLHDGTSAYKASLIRQKIELRWKLEPGHFQRHTPLPRLLIDATGTARQDQVTGIQRVVRNLSAAALESGLGVPVILWDKAIYPAISVEDPDWTPLAIHHGDFLILFDANWGMYREYAELIEIFQQAGGKVAAGVHDIIPYQYPALCAPGVVDLYSRWFETVVPLCDVVCCVSETTAEAVRKFIFDKGWLKPEPHEIFSVPLGHGLPQFPSSKLPSNLMAELCTKRPLFISIGTIEPRKGYDIVLTAFEHLWESNENLYYLILGRPGWSMDHFVHRMESLPYFNKNLFWLSDANDIDLAHAMSKADGLISASIAEGFGLPLVESSQFGCPLIISDIPAHREVAGANATYFDAYDPLELARCIRTSAKRSERGQCSTAKRLVGWEDTIRSLHQKLIPLP